MNNAFVRMNDSFVCTNGVFDTGRVSCETSTNEAFERMSDAFVLMNPSLVRMNDAFVRTKRGHSVRCSGVKVEHRIPESEGGSVRRTEPTELHQKWGMRREFVCFFRGTVFKSSVFRFLDVGTRSTTRVISSLAESRGAG